MQFRLAALTAILVLSIVPSADAADLGGNCCADLEERIAELESTTARKGNRKVRLTIGTPFLNFSKGSWSFDAPGGVVADTSNNPFAIQGSQVAILDRTGFGYADRGGLELMRGVDKVLAGTAFTSTNASNIWVSSLGSFAALDDGRLLDADQTLGGGLAGITFNTGSPLQWGVFGGAARSQLDADWDAESIETSYGIAGAYARTTTGRLLVDASLTGAWSSENGERVIATNIGPSAYQTAHRDFDGWIVAPALSLGWETPVGAGAVLTPAALLRGQFMHLDGYGETGQSSNATVAARDLDHAETRLELSFRQDFTATAFTALSLSAKAGLSVLKRFGDDDVRAQLLGTTLNFDAGLRETETGGYVGVGFDAALTQSVTMFADSEWLLTPDTQSIAGSIGLKAKY